MSVMIKHLKKKFGDFVALDDVSLKVDDGEFVGLLGPSGSGKTTLLRIIAGLDVADEGEIFLEGKDAAGKPIKERKIGFVFQHFALFKHMTVFENIAFGLRIKKPKISEQAIKEKVDSLLNLIHLKGGERKYPSELSGGQRQRVALARVLAIEPKYMLLDEPFGALDAKVRKELRRWLRNLHETAKLTTIFVTHDQEEAMEVSDRIAIIADGKLVQVGKPRELWEHPVNGFVFDFLGNYNTYFGYEIREGALVINKEFINENPTLFVSDKYVRALSRPHEVDLEKNPSDSKFYLQATIILINPMGPLIKMELEDEHGKIYQVEMEKSAFDSIDVKVKDKVWMKPQKYRSFDDNKVGNN
jgi:sulfate/thiosulfate transport system ATP-binding protein